MTYFIDVDYFKKLEIVFVIIICIFLYILFVTFIRLNSYFLMDFKFV